VFMGSLGSDPQVPTVTNPILPTQPTAAVDLIRNSEPEPIADETLAQALKTETGARRWVLMFAALEKATAFDIPGLIRAAGNDSAMTRMLAARWAELDPLGMFQSIQADYLLPEGSSAALPNRWVLSDVLFTEWIKRDSQAVFDAVTKAPDLPGRDNLRMNVVNQFMRIDVEKGLLAMKEWNIRNYLPDLKGVAEWAARDPGRAAQVVAQMGGEYAYLEALQVVGASWAKSDPKAGLQFAASLSPGQHAMLAKGIMSAWAERDIAGAVAAATAERDPLARAALAPGLVAAWGKTDPAAALAWSQEQMRGVARTEAIAGLIKAAAEKDLKTASELVADMKPGAAQNGACVSIFETWFNKGEGERTAAFDWLASLPDSAAQRAALEKVQWNWAWKEPDAVKEFISGPYGTLASQSMVHQVARNQTSKNPEAAMKWASQLPQDRANGAQQAVLDYWLQVRPEGAVEYARTLPAGAQREQAINTVTQTLIYQDPIQAAVWYRKLAGREQQNMREMIQRSGMPETTRKRLEAALSSP
jgi:hypothetical protein